MKRLFVEMDAKNNPREAVRANNAEKDKIVSLSELCSVDSATMLFHACRKFQREAVKKWNPNANLVTLSNYMGLVGIDKAAAKECGALALDLILKFGILVQDGDGL